MKRLNLVHGCLIALCIFMGSCSFKKLGKDVGSGLGEGIAATTDSIGRSLVAGVRDELTSPASMEKLAKTLDSLLNRISSSLKNTTANVRDIILNQKTLIWADSLLEALTGQKLSANVAALQAKLVGQSKSDVLDIINYFRSLLADVLSDSTKERLGAFRDEILGPKTNAAISKIIDSAVSHLIDSSLLKLSGRFKTDLAPLLKEQTSWVKKNAIELLLALFGLAAAIIFIVWRMRMRYLRLVTILSKQIHDIPDQGVYDKVTSKIKNEAVSTGLEPHLRNILIKNGLVGAIAWKKEEKK